MKATVIISYYKKLEYLKLVLSGLKKQSYTNFELIVAEDDINHETSQYIHNYKNEVTFNVLLLQQEDKGFRKNKILNEAIKQASGDFLIFLDGDCIPHQHLVKSYIDSLDPEEKYLYAGRRVMLSENISNQLLTDKNLSRLNVLNLILSQSKHIEEGIYLPFDVPKKKNKGLLGCNFGILKKDLLAINGFDEDYIKAGVGEDTDIEWRLRLLNFNIYPMKFKAIVYHIHHSSNYSEVDVAFNTKIMNEKIKNKNVQCLNGINKLS